MFEKGQWLETAGDPAVALDCLERAADVLEGLRADLREVELQIGALGDKEAVYGWLLRHAARPGADPVEGVRVMERCKARRLLDELSSRPATAPAPAGARDAAAAAHLAEEAGLLRRQIVRAMTRRANAVAQDLAPGGGGAGALNRLKSRLADVFRRQYRPARPTPSRGATAEEVCRLGSAPGAAVLHFFRDPAGVLVTPVVGGTPRETRLLPEATPPALRDLLDGMRFELEARIPCRSLEELFRVLLLPLEDLLSGATRLLVLPHDLLHAVPFHALCRTRARGAGGIVRAGACGPASRRR